MDYALARQYRAIFYIATVLIVYGSLYPFNFVVQNSYFLDAVEVFLRWEKTARRGDILGNVALFVPFGAAGMLALVPGRPAAAKFVLLSLFGLSIATGVQILQIFLPSRDPALADVLWNLCGWTAGALLVWPAGVRARLLAHVGVGIQLVPFFLMACWLVSELAPFVPSIDLQAYKDSLKLLLTLPDLLSVAFFSTFIFWLVILDLAGRLWPERAHGPWLIYATLGVVFAKIVIVQNSVSSGDVLAVVLAIPSWLLLRNAARRIPVLIVALLFLLVITALAPFTLRATAHPFSWVPFSGALSGSMLVNVKAVASKLFLLGSLLYFMRLAGLRSVVSVSLIVVLAAALEFVQIWVGDHTPVITDPLLALLLGATLALLHPEHAAGVARRAATAVRPAVAGEGDDRHRPPERADISAAAALLGGTAERAAAPAGGARFNPNWRAVLLALGGCVAIAFVLHTILGLRQIPYNVRELFGGEDTWWRLFLFSLAALSIGSGGAFVGRLTADRGRAVVVLPAGAIAVCLVTYLLLASSVTAESISDIAGAPNTYRLVMDHHIWGDFGVWLYQTIGSKVLIQTVERFVRFTALAGQAVLWIAILSTVYFRLAGAAQRDPASQARGALSTGLSCFLAAVPWLVLFNLVAFDYAATDNLTELIDGHGHILYFLLILLPVDALFVLHALRRPTPGRAVMAVAVLAVSLPIGWLLLKNGFSPTVGKYGHTFSGVDFLLGPDRKDLLPESILAARWFAVQGAAIAMLVLGMQAVPEAVGSKR